MAMIAIVQAALEVGVHPLRVAVSVVTATHTAIV